MSVKALEGKVSEQALRESESKYRFLFENMMNGFAYHKMLFDDEGKPVDYVYLEVNDAFEKMTGRCGGEKSYRAHFRCRT
jgi:PAS domain-containing protein